MSVFRRNLAHWQLALGTFASPAILPLMRLVLVLSAVIAAGCGDAPLAPSTVPAHPPAPLQDFLYRGSVCHLEPLLFRLGVVLVCEPELPQPAPDPNTCHIDLDLRTSPPTGVVTCPR